MTKTGKPSKTGASDSARPAAQPKQPTLKTIAGLTGLAVPTVSRALGGASDISIATRARVRAVADEIGYVPNRAGVRLRTGRTNVISLVLSTEHEMMNHTAKLISSVAAGLRATPFHVIITPYFGDEDPMKPVRYIVETRSADALILNQIKPEDPRVAYLMEKNFPFVTHGRTIWEKDHPFYDFDNHAFAQIAVQEFAARQRKNIVLVAPPRDQTYSVAMINGATEAASRLGLGLTVLSDVHSDVAIDDMGLALSQHLDAGHPVDGVICVSNGSCLAAITALETAGHVIGDTVDICAKEAMPILQRIRSPIITVRENVANAGLFLAQAAMSAVLTPREPPMQFLEVPQTSEN